MSFKRRREKQAEAEARDEQAHRESEERIAAPNAAAARGDYVPQPALQNMVALVKKQAEMAFQEGHKVFVTRGKPSR